METVKLGYFSVERCGYYAHGEQEPKFGGITEALQEIFAWTRGQTLRATKVYTPPEDSNQFPVYLSDIAIDHVSGDAVVVTWNETPSFDGAISAAAGDDVVGEVSVSQMDIPTGAIPGFPCYFFFVPSKRALIAVRFEGQTHSGQPGVAGYIQEFLARYSPHVVTRPNSEGVDITAYVESPESEPARVMPHYRTKALRASGKIDWLRDNVLLIRKLVRKDAMMSTDQAIRSRLQPLWTWLGVAQPTSNRRLIKFDFEIDCQLSIAEFEAIVESHLHEAHISYKDVGFRLTRDPEVYWLSHSIVKQEVTIEVHRTENGAVKAEDLLRECRRLRSHIVSLIPDDQ